MKASQLTRSFERSYRRLSALVAGAALISVQPVMAAPFGVGNLVVERIGDGTTTPVGNSAALPVAILEFKPDGTAQQTFTTEFTGSNLLTDTGNSSSHGNLNSNGAFLAVSGYNSALATPSVAGLNTKVANVFGAAGTVAGRVTFPTGGPGATPPSPFSGNSFRSVVPTSATTFYASGTSSGTPNTGGPWYCDGTNFTQLSTSVTNLRNIAIFNNQLYVTSASGAFLGVSAVGTGTPTTSGQTTTLVIDAGTGSSTYGFVIFDTDNNGVVDRAYLADDRIVAGGGLRRYDFNGTTWTNTYSLLFDTNTGTLTGTAGTGIVGIRGLTGKWSNGTATLYASTTEASNNKLVSITDSGSAPASFMTLASAGANNVFRGVTFAPAELSSRLIVTEINSNATGGDFWELTNVGDAPVNIGSWKWDDDSRNPADAAAVTIPAGTNLPSGASIIFTNATSDTVFRNNWGALPGIPIVVGGPGLGGGDGVALFNTAGTEIFFFSYAANGFVRSDGSNSMGGHAGPSAATGANDAQSAVLDPSYGIGSGRRYAAATVGTFGAYASTAGGFNIGSPGVTGISTGGPTAVLTVSVTPATFSESATNPAATGMVSRAVATASDLVVNLASSDTTEATVPATVTILANQTSANFNVTAVNDTFPDGSKVATITAAAPGATAGTFQVTVTDDGDVITHNLMLTEILSNQSSPNTAGADEDYWELTNFGATAVDISGFSWHDSGRSAAAAAAYAFPAGSTINAGESIILTATDPTVFRNWWGLAPTVKVFQAATAPGLGSSDGVSFFDNGGNELFFFSYAASGFTRADGSASTGGHAGPSAGAGADTIAMIWVPTSSTTVTTGTNGANAPRYTFATGTNFGSRVAATNADIGSPGATVGNPTVSIASASLTEGNNLTSTLALNVTRSDTTTDFTVGYSVTGGTATSDTDYATLAAGTLTFSPGGAATQPINITINGDTTPEPDETIIITLANVNNTTGMTGIGTAVGTGTIINDDIIAPLITTHPANTTIATGYTATLTVAASGFPAPTFQWYQGNSGNTSNPVSGATSATFTTPALTTTTNYWARATNTGGTADSNTATVTVIAGATSVDLSTYVRVGRYDLPEPTRTTPPVNNLLAQEASGVTYNWDSDTLFIVGDGGTSVTQVTKTGALVNTMTLPPGGSPQGTEFYDTEGITYIGGGQFVFAEERVRQAVKFTYVGGGTLLRSATQTVKLGTTIGNLGLEGLTWDPQTGGFIFVKEAEPLGIFQTTIDFTNLTASNGSPTTVNSTDLFNPALASLEDMSDVFAFSNLPSMTGQPSAGNLLILSQESGMIRQVDRSGNIVNTLTLVADAGNPLTIQNQTHEGLTMDRAGIIYVVSENGGGDTDHPQLWVYAPSTATNFAPTALALSTPSTTIPDSTSTALPIKMATIVVTDADGVGVNNFSVSGADAADFQFIGSGLYLKAGTVLNGTTKPSYSVTVNVDDTTVGGTPDASANFTLNVTGAGGGASPIRVTEAAPWSSGNSALAADWFELTNTGSTAVNITGWRMFDSGASGFGGSGPLNGITSIAAGETVIFVDGQAKVATFLNHWFGGTPPPGFQIGYYGGPGLSTDGDAVTIYNGSGTLQARVDFGASPTAAPRGTFDNSARLNAVTLTQLSVVGQNGAFTAPASANDIGSPGLATVSGSPLVSIVATDDSASETGPGTGTFRISRTGSTISSLQVVFTIATGAGQAVTADYTPTLTSPATIPAGQAFVDITITPEDDTAIEGAETVTLTLGDTGSYDVGSPSAATVTITDTPNGFAAWLAANGFTSGGINGDTDNDGIPDSLEYFFNASPNSGGDRDNLPQVVMNGSDIEFRFTYLTGTALPGYLQSSNDLINWVNATPGVDYEIITETVNGTETAVRFRIFCNPTPTATGPFTYLTPFTAEVERGAIGGLTITNHGMVGAGRMSGEALDSFGETQGASSGLSITGWSYNVGTGQFSGTFNVLPDRGYNNTVIVPNIYSNYAARVHAVPFTFVPYYGAGPVAQTQIVPTYSSTTKFSYLDGSTTKLTTGLNPTAVTTLFGQSVGTVPAFNLATSTTESLLSFDAEAIHVFADGSGFVSDEYGTYIARFNAAKQFTKLIQLPASAQPHKPVGTLNFEAAAAPLNGRRNNQGLEGLSVSPDGTRLMALMQSALVQDTSGSQQQTRFNTRLYVYDIAGANLENPVLIGEYAVQLPRYDLNGNNSSLDVTAAQSEIVALSNTQFLMLPRDGNGLGKSTADPIVTKTVDLVDFSAATNVLGLYDAEANPISPAGNLLATITPAKSTVVINLLSTADLTKFGFNTNTTTPNQFTVAEKIEAMALVPDTSTVSTEDYFLFVANDNDFQSSDVRMLDASGNIVSYGDARSSVAGSPKITNDAVFTAWRITICPDNRKFFRLDVDTTP